MGCELIGVQKKISHRNNTEHRLVPIRQCTVLPFIVVDVFWTLCRVFYSTSHIVLPYRTLAARGLEEPFFWASPIFCQNLWRSTNLQVCPIICVPLAFIYSNCWTFLVVCTAYYWFPSMREPHSSRFPKSQKPILGILGEFLGNFWGISGEFLGNAQPR